ncbi:MAG TPA: NAD-dependent epimerase/dehydratase family protein, partial [Gaiellaceae bacterium]|nr:NAD-dependent epimerase/dehydratase family protein [Gaiellaceae bacterium]
MRVVVTGGAGFIGSHVADAFVERGDEVLVVDDLSTGSRDRVPASAALAELDVADGQRLRTALSDFGAELVCHLAAQASVTVSVSDPELDFASNVRGTFNVCRAAAGLGARVLFASTGGALYGNEAPIPTPETFVPQPLSPYGASKLAAEAFVATEARAQDLAHVVLRLGNVYGPRQNPHGEAGVVA